MRGKGKKSGDSKRTVSKKTAASRRPTNWREVSAFILVILFVLLFPLAFLHGVPVVAYLALLYLCGAPLQFLYPRREKRQALAEVHRVGSPKQSEFAVEPRRIGGK
jgi:hypothetical protein